ncbi:tRNA/tmRNA/rRNA uracil-C5-methylase (TrmA/RlmC/RlmD family) [Diaminobutyricimonas aerilata]|uniref:tRNA/tmRNA/rRNA uracil-C5-methylase (TrmA/RlmC/RlmD family) n=2 Tax=Diaminobutyricimonas aerilata TaxID=1162967 RepID=A0A2M9CGZ4_9MICO|nr:tRNA/tmRNA/rRNA uracil-C5-methylase (TrmA/RlmC/RlmD family) [Diaminobutyricimonas aerilata]
MEGSELELAVTNVAHGGITVARHEGRVVFVSDAIPGERVVARVTDAGKAKFWRADTVRVLEASPHRREHIWPEAAHDRDPADRAGGAEFGHIDPAHQRELKRQVVVDALQRFGGVERDVEVEALPGAADGTGWRTRVRLHVDERGRLGPYAARSHRVIPVSSLPLATERLQKAAPLAEEFGGVGHVDVLAPSVGDPRLVVGEQAPSVIRERVGSREFQLADTGFWQVHEHAAETLSAAVSGAVDETLFDPRAANLDLYGGVGLFAAAVGDRFGSTVRITSVEGDALATDHAAENLAEWVGANAVTGRVERWLAAYVRDASAIERARLRAATVVLDPPRSGAGKQVVAALGDAAPAQIVYVACDPVAFARDVALLRDRGYELDSLRSFDLFPNTHHVEALGHFRRRD